MAAKKDHHSKVDEALGLAEGKHFEEDLTALLTAENAETGENIHIVMIDLDNFLQVNENFGFDEGNRVLIETGNHLKQ